MIYLDTCYLLKCYLAEPGAPEVRELVDAADGVASSVHARVEFMAAVHRHFREIRMTSISVTFVVWIAMRGKRFKVSQAGAWAMFRPNVPGVSVCNSTARTHTDGVAANRCS